jgi:hypothetical protein
MCCAKTRAELGRHEAAIWWHAGNDSASVSTHQNGETELLWALLLIRGVVREPRLPALTNP